LEYNILKNTFIGRIILGVLGLIWFFILIAIVLAVFDEYMLSSLYGIGLIVLGFILFLSAKIHVFKKGKFFSFGTNFMSEKISIIYYAGYFLILSGLLVSFTFKI